MVSSCWPSRLATAVLRAAEATSLVLLNDYYKIVRSDIDVVCGAPKRQSMRRVLLVG
jgi:hypothetical protein